MAIVWREVALPAFGEDETAPEITRETYLARCERAYAAAGADWLVVYGDREHSANLAYLTHFDPRFEEAILLLGPGDRRVLLVGNEGLVYAGQARLPVDVALCQSLSLPGQDRTQAPRLGDVLRGAGITAGQRVGLVGWKYLEPEEQEAGPGSLPGFFAPAMLVDTLRVLVSDPAAVTDATPVLLHPTTGLRARVEPEQIAAFEWGAARATAAVWRIVRGVRVGMTGYEAVRNMAFAGDPLTAHVLFDAGAGEIVGLRSPSARRIAHGDGISTAVGFWGGLGSRAGLVTEAHAAFVSRVAVPYFETLAMWYGVARVGAVGGDIHAAVAESLAPAGLRSALNPGHLTGHDEWVHSPVRPGSTDRLASGMAFQCDIIPVPMPPGWAINCEDPVILADATLRETLARRYPAMWARISARQRFMRDALGITLSDDVLPLSTTPAYLPPCWLAPNTVMVVE